MVEKTKKSNRSVQKLQVRLENSNMIWRYIAQNLHICLYVYSIGKSLKI